MENTPSIDLWLKEAKADAQAHLCGMYLTHNGVVRESPRAQVRNGVQDAKPVKALLFSYDRHKAQAAIAQAKELPGIHYVRVWLNEGELGLGDDIMLVLVGGDIRPNVIDALQFLVGKLKTECVSETEIY